MKRGQLAAVIIIVLLVAVVAGIMLFSQKRAGRALQGPPILIPAEGMPAEPSCPKGTIWIESLKTCVNIEQYALQRDAVKEEIERAKR